jgi:predicted metal-dependent hydrolase
MEYQLVRSDRKSMVIRVTRDAEVVVCAPRKAPRRDIDRFVREKRAWIDGHLAEMRRRKARRDAFAPYYGDMVLLNGREYPIVSVEGRRAGFDGKQITAPAGLSAAQVKRLMIQVYRMVAEQVLPARTSYYAERMGVRPSGVCVTAARTRWGSCSGKNSINYSWRLILAPDEAIDYVVVHELAHIREHNHSERFWRIVESVLPDYRRRKKQLAGLQERLGAEDWG